MDLRLKKKKQKKNETDCPSVYKPIAGGEATTEAMAPSCLWMWKGEEPWEISKHKFSVETGSFSSCPNLQGTAEVEAAPGLPEGRLNYYSSVEPVTGNSTEHEDRSS